MKFLLNIILWPLEYVCKIIAGFVAVLVLAAPGSFFAKIAAGFSSIVEAVRTLTNWPEQIQYFSALIDDYNTLTASEFHQRYGGDAINSFMGRLNESVSYLQNVYQNIVEQPVATIIAALLAFSVFYLAARVLRFIRQRGKGSYLTRKEREIGERVFDNR